MILEVNPESLRDIAAAINAARKREPDAEVLAEVERSVLIAIKNREGTLVLEPLQANALRNSLLQRAYDQRNTSEAMDYSDLAERIERALDDAALPVDEVQ
ncbi:MAG TPA: hypothetical protein VNE62_01975 [Actinomycetota bacterium]|nr:hypothetical protein [Actinomycetota bacterium]